MPSYLETLTSYLPLCLRQQLLKEAPQPLNAPRIKSMLGAFLFGDITGFTPLTVTAGPLAGEANPLTKQNLQPPGL